MLSINSKFQENKMRTALFFTLVFCIAVVAANAQKPADFSGKWSLDVAKSKLGDRNNIESQTLTVTQTSADIKIETSTKRAAPPAGAPAGGPGGGGRGFGGGGDMPVTYTLDGKEVKSEVDGPGGSKIPVSMTGKFEGGKLVLTRSSTFNGPNGEVKTTNKETWELSADGKSLTVNTERTSFRGTDSTTKVFTKG
jgi:hypothetical protein